MFVKSAAAAWINPRKRDKNRDILFFLSCFFLSNSYTLQTQPDRLAEYGVCLPAQGPVAHHSYSADEQCDLQQAFF